MTTQFNGTKRPFSKESIANASMPSSFEEVDVSAADYEPTGIDAEFMIYVGTGGDIKVDGAIDGTEIVFKNVPDGTWIPGIFKVIYTANTTASDIVVGR